MPDRRDAARFGILRANGGAPYAAGSIVAVTIGDASQNVPFVVPSSTSVAAVVMFPGGDGVIGISSGGSIARPGNFRY